MFSYCPYCAYKISTQDKNGFQCSSCRKRTHYVSPPTASVVVKVEEEMLLSVRGIDPAKGTLDIVGGFLQKGEDPLLGAVREFKEETGFTIDPNDLKILAIRIGNYDYQGEDIMPLNIIFIIEMAEKPKLKPNDDVKELRWVPIQSEYEFAFPYLYSVHDEVKKLV